MNEFLYTQILRRIEQKVFSNLRLVFRMLGFVRFSMYILFLWFYSWFRLPLVFFGSQKEFSEEFWCLRQLLLPNVMLKLLALLHIWEFLGSVLRKEACFVELVQRRVQCRALVLATFTGSDSAAQPFPCWSLCKA
jgi:hypothetical protein